MTAPASAAASATGRGREVLIEVRGLCKSFARGDAVVQVLDRLDLDIEAGSYAALMGASGSGKSTLLNLLGGLDRPDAGSIRVLGEDIAAMDADDLAGWRARSVGFIFQLYNLLPVLRAVENVELPLSLFGLPRRERRRRATRVLEMVGLGDRVDHYPNELSGGQEQRVAIARALVTDPTFLLADEPTGDLDPSSSEEILDLIDRLHRELGKTVLMVTHSKEAAARAEHIVHMEHGKVVVAEGR